MLVEKKCKVCGKTHKVKSADLKRGWGKCCSKSCAAVLRERELDRFNYQRSSLIRKGNRSISEFCTPDEEDYYPGTVIGMQDQEDW